MGLPIRLSPLDHRRPDVAAEIQRLMRAAYEVEAGLLGVAEFVPLRRTAEDIAGASSRFLGALLLERLAGVAEIETVSSGPVNIGSLVVHPDHFRRGLATAMLRRIIDTHGDRDLTVSTGILNRPALHLYAGFGFRDHHRWRTDDGIPMVMLMRHPVAPAR